ncbi:hypothetical protein V9T40_007409 [Parthenolecanium corni]|uniref:Uncharacterized protein n=1 Tax=Parthenolecanium corni TaxID=536013 RepID=A0AAN9TYC0_9HEMI
MNGIYDCRRLIGQRLVARLIGQRRDGKMVRRWPGFERVGEGTRTRLVARTRSTNYELRSTNPQPVFRTEQRCWLVPALRASQFARAKCNGLLAASHSVEACSFPVVSRAPAPQPQVTTSAPAHEATIEPSLCGAPQASRKIKKSPSPMPRPTNPGIPSCAIFKKRIYSHGLGSKKKRDPSRVRAI